MVFGIGCWVLVELGVERRTCRLKEYGVPFRLDTRYMPRDTGAMEPGVYLVGTPIGNLGDLSPRAVAVLREVDVIMAEDTRQTLKLLNRFEIKTHLMSCHKFNEASRVRQVLDRVEAGQAVALVTDSGMPGVSDQGARLVRACRQAGVVLSVIPGPSAVTAAVALCGMVENGFLFEGFLSHKSAARKRRLDQLADMPVPVIFFESPYRLLKLLREIEEVLGSRSVFVGRELTKKFEEHLWGTPAEILEQFGARTVKGECVVVLGPAAKA